MEHWDRQSASAAPRVVTTTLQLEELCRSLRDVPFVAIDTEFVHSNTYYPRLCLVQIADPSGNVVVVDVLSVESLAALGMLLAQENVVKVFHAARNDIRIFWNLFGSAPHPMEDTQVMALACGLGEMMGFDAIVKTLTGRTIDKQWQYTNWSRRPMTAEQLRYAADDAALLVTVYKKLSAEIDRLGRREWIVDEMEKLKATRSDPRTAWKKLRIRSSDPEYVGIVIELAAWREAEAQRRNLVCNLVMKNDIIFDIAHAKPRTLEALDAVYRVSCAHEVKQSILDGVSRGVSMSPEETKHVMAEAEPSGHSFEESITLLRLLLSIKCRDCKVAPRLLATTDDLRLLSQGNHKEGDLPCLKGWRYDIFGRDALEMLRGRLCVLSNGKSVVAVPTTEEQRYMLGNLAENQRHDAATANSVETVVKQVDLPQRDPRLERDFSSQPPRESSGQHSSSSQVPVEGYHEHQNFSRQLPREMFREQQHFFGRQNISRQPQREMFRGQQNFTDQPPREAHREHNSSSRQPKNKQRPFERTSPPKYQDDSGRGETDGRTDRLRPLCSDDFPALGETSPWNKEAKHPCGTRATVNSTHHSTAKGPWKRPE